MGSKSTIDEKWKGSIMSVNKKLVVSLMPIFLSACAGEGLKFWEDEPAKVNTELRTGANSQGCVGDNTQLEEGVIVDRLTSVTLGGQQAEGMADDVAGNTSLAGRTIYFEYDSSQIRKEFIPVLEAHGLYLMNNPKQTVVIEGHSDERGSREYNIALAEQRAKSVYKMLQLIGVMNHQMKVLSYGEEKPLNLEHTESAFERNRRAVVVYQ